MTIFQDFRHGLRFLRKSPGFTALAILTLAVGIGVNAAMFGALDAILIRPLPYHDPNRLVAVWEKNPLLEGIIAERLQTCPENYQGWKSGASSFEQMGALAETSFNLTGVEKPLHLAAAFATADLFKTLGVSATAGRGFTAEEEAEGKNHVVVLSHDFFQQQFGGDTHVLNRSLMLDGQSYQIIGVLPQSFHLPHFWEGMEDLDAKIFVPLNASLSRPKREVQNRNMLVLARLKPQATIEQARGEMAVLAKQLEQKDPDLNKGFGVNVFPLRVEDLGEDAPTVMLALQGAVGFVLLIACANIANLLLARATRREKEIAVRMALGAKRSRIISQMLGESLTLSLLGGATGLLLAQWAIRTINKFAPPDLLGKHELRFDPMVFGFALVVAVTTGILFGIAPALHAVRQDIHQTLTSTARGLSGRGGKTRAVLVVTEVSLALVRWLGAGVMVRSLRSLHAVDPGFVPEHLLTARLVLPAEKYQTPEQVTAFDSKVLERIKALPGVQSAALASGLPLETIAIRGFHLEGQTQKDAQSADVQQNTEGYFRTMGSPILGGREFTAEEVEQQAHVTIVNEALARRLWSKENPIGKKLIVSVGNSKPWEPYLIVGVVPDTHQLGLDTPARSEMYFPGRAYSTMSLVLRTAGEPAALGGSLTRAVLDVDQDQPLTDVLPMEKILGDSLLFRRFGMWLTVAFAGLAMLLATSGLYSVLAYVVTQRTHEIGVRMALGARRLDVVRMIVRQGITLTLVGLVVGLAGSLGLARVLSSFVFGVKATDPLTLGTTMVILIGVSLLASFLPAGRAMKVDPMVALRHE